MGDDGGKARNEWRLHPANDANFLATTPMFRLRGELSIVDRVVSAAEAERELGLAFGKGNGAGYIGLPSSAKVTIGWVSAVAAVDSPFPNNAQGASGPGRVDRATRARRAAYWGCRPPPAGPPDAGCVPIE